MAHYSVQITLKTTTNLAKDYATNTWSIFADDVAALTVAAAQLADFYDDIQAIFSDNVLQNGHEIKAYDRADVAPRAPVLETTFDFTTAPTGEPLPHEVCITLSFQGAKTSGAPQARRRGRVYLGPIREAGVDSDGRIASFYVTTVIDAADDFLTASDAASAWTWNVWSTVNDAAVIITDGWVDNAFDTQRRRGRVATSRSTFS